MCGDLFYRSQLSGLWIETVFYGFNAAVFIGSVYVLTHHRRSKYYLATSISIFVLCTGNVVLDLVRILLSRETTADSDVIGSTAVACTTETETRLKEAVLEDFLFILSDAVNGLAMLVADALLISRCFILWHHKRWIVYPLIPLLLATAACNFAAVYYDAMIYHLRLATPLSEDPIVPAWVKAENLYSVMASAGYALTLATNVLATLCISLRIWFVKRELQRSLGRVGGAKHYDSAIAIIVESGALLSFSVIVTLICLYTTPLYSIIANNASFQLVGIAPTLIIIRVGLAASIESEAPVQLSGEMPRSGTAHALSHSIRFADREQVESVLWPTSAPAEMEKEPGMSRSSSGGMQV